MASDWDQFPAASPVDVALQLEGVTGKTADVARSIYQQESGSGKNTKTSNAGARGGMQIIPSTFKQVADKDWNIDDPIHNARAGVRYVKMLDERGGGDPALTAAGYYGGPGGQDKARKGIPVSDPRNPKAPNTLEYGQQVAQRIEKGAPKPASASSAPDNWDAFPEVKDAPASGSQLQAAQQQKRSVVEDIGRQLGLSVRAGVNGVVSLPAMAADAVTGPINAGLDAVQGERKGFRFKQAGKSVDDLMTAAGVPVPENATERVVQDIAGGMAGAGGMVASGRALAAGGGAVAKSVGDVLSAGPKLQVGSAAAGSGAAGVTRENGGGQGAQLAAGITASLAPALLPAAGAAAIRGALRGGESGRQRIAQNLETFEAAGVQPTVGQAAGGKLQRLEALVAKAPGGAGRIAAYADKQADDMALAVQKLSDELAPGANAMNAGEAIAKGITAFKEGVKVTQQKLYANLDQHLPLDTPIQVPKTQEALKALNADIPGAPNISEFFKNAKIKGIDRALQADLEKAAASGSDDLAAQSSTLPYQAIKKLRTLVGNEISDSNLVSDVPRSKWQALYGALSDDLGVAATKAGPEAAASWQWANQYTKSQIGRLEQLSNIVAKDSPEKIFAAATAGTLEGDTIIKRVINALPKQERREVAAAVLQRMGRATAGQQNAMGDAFSSETFLTNLSKLSPASRKTLFGRTDVAGIEEQVGKFANVAEMRREGGKIFANPSGTASTGAQLVNASALGAGITGSLTTGNPLPMAAALLAPVSANIGARAMTNPQFVKKLAQSTTLPDGALGAGLAATARAAEVDSLPPQPSVPTAATQESGNIAPPEGVAPEVNQASPLLEESLDAPTLQTEDPIDQLDLPDGSLTTQQMPTYEDAEGQELSASVSAPIDKPSGVSGAEAFQATASRPDGTLSFEGDPNEIKQTLMALGVPEKSLIAGPGGVIVGRSQVANVTDAITKMMLNDQAGQPAEAAANIQVAQETSRDSRDEILRRLRDEGEDTAADLLMAQGKAKDLDEAANKELNLFAQLSPDAQLPTDPQFQSVYREFRSSGVKPGEAAAHTAIQAGFAQIAQKAGLSQKAMSAALGAAKNQAIDKAPQFLERFVNALAAKGAAIQVEPGQIASELEQQRDSAMQVVVSSLYHRKAQESASPNPAPEIAPSPAQPTISAAPQDYSHLWT